MVTVQRSFSAVTNPVTTVNDSWPAVIICAVEQQSYWLLPRFFSHIHTAQCQYGNLKTRQLKDEGSSVWIWVLRNETTHTNRLITTNTYQSYHISLLNPIYSFIYMFLSFENCAWTVWKKIYQNFKLSRVQLPKSYLIFIPVLKNRNNIFNVLQMQHFLSFLKKKTDLITQFIGWALRLVIESIKRRERRSIVSTNTALKGFLPNKVNNWGGWVITVFLEYVHHSLGHPSSYLLADSGSFLPKQIILCTSLSTSVILIYSFQVIHKGYREM